MLETYNLPVSCNINSSSVKERSEVGFSTGEGTEKALKAEAEELYDLSQWSHHHLNKVDMLLTESKRNDDEQQPVQQKRDE